LWLNIGWYYVKNKEMGIFDMFQRKNNQPDPLTKIVETHPDFRTESHTVGRLEADCFVSFAETRRLCLSNEKSCFSSGFRRVPLDIPIRNYNNC
jgi:hypothetical protein